MKFKTDRAPIEVSDIKRIGWRLSSAVSDWRSHRELAPGIFHFKSDPDFIAADYRAFDDAALAVIGKYRDTDAWALVPDLQSHALLDGTLITTEKHAQHSQLVPIATRPTLSILFASGPARSLLVLHAGIEWRGYSTKRALKDFDEHIATSAHARLEARSMLRRRLQAA